MFVLDTNVVSELMRAAPDRAVLRWVSARPLASLYTTSITEAEVLHGIMLLPRGKRRDAMEIAARAMFDDDFRGRVLAFGGDAARMYAEVRAGRSRAGKPIGALDAQIAAIARAVDAAIVTRNADDFEDAGVSVINPWR